MKPEVGKTYVDGYGNLVKITGESFSEDYPFIGDNGLSYTGDGGYLCYEPSENDLIREHISEPTIDTIEPGTCHWTDSMVERPKHLKGESDE